MDLKVLIWGEKDKKEDTPICLIFPILKDGETCWLIITPHNLYYVGYKRLDGIFRIFRKEKPTKREKDEVDLIVEYLEQFGMVVPVKMGIGYLDIEKVAGISRYEIILSRTELHAAINYICYEDNHDYPTREGGKHHLFITQGFLEALRSKLVQKHFSQNLDIGAQMPLEYIWSEHIWTVASNRLLLPSDRAPDFKVCSIVPLTNAQLYSTFSVLKKHGDNQLASDPDHSWLKLNSTAMYLYGMHESRRLLKNFVKSSSQQRLSADGDGAGVEVDLRKHIFDKHAVLEYQFKNTSPRWLKIVEVSVVPDTPSFTEQEVIRPIGILGPGVCRYTYVMFRKDHLLSFAVFTSTVRFVEADSKEAAQTMEDGQVANMKLKTFNIGVLDYLNHIKTLPDFETEWELLGSSLQETSCPTFTPDRLPNFIAQLRTLFFIWKDQDLDSVRVLFLHGQCCGIKTQVLVKAHIYQPGENGLAKVEFETRTRNLAFQAGMHAFVAEEAAI